MIFIISPGKLVREKRGQALVELALVLPLLLLLLMGIMESGRIFHSYLLITNASREGARAGVTGAGDAEIQEKVKDAAEPIHLSDSQITITPAQSYRTRGAPLTVQVNCTVDLITPVLDAVFPDPFPLTSSTTMRVE
ncbi:flp pilus assembly protein TadG [Pelotomaculum thermopropionicum SI]|uniref:Flp pilus assembly protein TadG n=1 Tax=Pelotomaculum thermopropionicum (strain DSM 13744 / JCM 10971 / SI) TaxID=370438 RepID=A5D2B3_PELTS|nr:flp pilus assembly protein TadG [Pelotomaculum thermopropionicum SI]